MNKLKSIKGFTLIEMMVVIAVIGILSAVVLGGLAPGRKKARDVRVTSGVNQIRAIIEAATGVGGYPTVFPPEGNVTAGDVHSANQEGVFYSGSGNTYKLCAKLPSTDNNYYCVDQTGLVTQGLGHAGADAPIIGSSN